MSAPTYSTGPLTPPKDTILSDNQSLSTSTYLNVDFLHPLFSSIIFIHYLHPSANYLNSPIMTMHNHNNKIINNK